MNMPQTTKICNACQQSFGLEMFSLNKARKDGRESKCRACMKLKQDAQYARHKDKRRAEKRVDNLSEDQVSRKREYDRQYRERNKNMLNAYLKEWRIRHKGYRRPNTDEYNRRRAEAAKERYANNPEYREHVKALAKLYRERRTPEQKADSAKRATEYRWSRIDRSREYAREYQQEYRKTAAHESYIAQYREENIDKIKARSSVYKAKRGFTSNDHIIHLHKWQENHCYWCNAKMSKKECTLDHVVPLSMGGSADNRNVVLACKSCNFSKQNRLYGIEWTPKVIHAPAHPWTVEGATRCRIEEYRSGIWLDCPNRDDGLIVRSVYALSSFWCSDRCGTGDRWQFGDLSHATILWDADLLVSPGHYVRPNGFLSEPIDGELESLEFFDATLPIDAVLKANGIFSVTPNMWTIPPGLAK